MVIAGKIILKQADTSTNTLMFGERITSGTMLLTRTGSAKESYQFLQKFLYLFHLFINLIFFRHI